MKNRHNMMQVVVFIVVLGLLVFAAVGDARLMFWVSLFSMLLLFVWFVSDRKTWLAAVSGLVFAISVLWPAKTLF